MFCSECGIDLEDTGQCPECGLCPDCCECETDESQGLLPLHLASGFDADEFGEEPEDEFERRTR